MSDFDILVVGEINADLILSGDDVIPTFGQVEKLIDDATLTIGASSCIFACGAAQLGLRVTFAGRVGDDPIGRFMLNSLNARGVDTSGVSIDPHLKTGLTVILANGLDRALLTYLGTTAALQKDDVDLSRLARARHLHIGSYFLLNSLRRYVPELFDAAHARGLSVSIDTNYDPTERWNGSLNDALTRADIFLPNETELSAIAARLPSAPAYASIDAALATLAKHVPIVAVKQGERGATAQRGQQIVHSDTIPVSVVDTTGAGNSFDAGFVYGFLAGWDLDRTLRLACICGTLSTQSAGGTTAQPALDEALAYMDTL